MGRRLQGWKEKVGGWEVSQLVRQSLLEERMAFVVHPPHSNLVVNSQPLSPCKKQTSGLRRGRAGTLLN